MRTASTTARHRLTSTVLVALAATVVLVSGCARDETSTAPQPPSPAASAITGLVTAADTGKPLTDVIVGFYDATGQPVDPIAKTDSSGRYRAPLAPGAYMIYVNVPTAEKPRGWNGYAPAWTDGSPVTPDRQTLVVRAGETLEYDAVLQPVRVVSGVVRTAGGPGIPPTGANVGVIEPTSGKGFGAEPLAPSGEYRILLPDGEWMVQIAVAGYEPAYSPKFTVSGAPVTIPDITIQPG